MTVKKIISVVLCALYFSSWSQDIHWSQYDHNPVFQNPGNVGQFNGDFRFHANYRDQWRSVTVPFQTLNLSAEAKGLFDDNLNIGVLLFNDIAGDGKFRTIEFLPSASYLIKLTADSTHLFRPGIQMGINFRSLNSGAFTFDNQWNGIFFDNNLATNETFQTESKTNFTWGLGGTYEYSLAKRKRIITGIALFNINRPNQGFFGDKIKRDMRFNWFARGEYKVGFDWDVLPSFQLNIQGTYSEFILGSQVRYILKDRLGEYRALMAGLFLRSRDAGYLVAGMEYQNWWAGVSYDLNYSNLYVVSRARGGIEFSVRYIFSTFNPKNVIYRICPDYI
ncbi:MAG: PorP/SprF family type IX secretion system membrane protein [Brumimicrobium sp.]|nr:PorP/SprF family type IX secretion system membrane protein [Brumimicrobium sp.]